MLLLLLAVGAGASASLRDRDTSARVDFEAMMRVSMLVGGSTASIHVCNEGGPGVGHRTVHISQRVLRGRTRRGNVLIRDRRSRLIVLFLELLLLRSSVFMRLLLRCFVQLGSISHTFHLLTLLCCSVVL